MDISERPITVEEHLLEILKVDKTRSSTNEKLHITNRFSRHGAKRSGHI